MAIFVSYATINYRIPFLKKICSTKKFREISLTVNLVMYIIMYVASLVILIYSYTVHVVYKRIYMYVDMRGPYVPLGLFGIHYNTESLRPWYSECRAACMFTFLCVLIFGINCWIAKAYIFFMPACPVYIFCASTLSMSRVAESTI